MLASVCVTGTLHRIRRCCTEPVAAIRERPILNLGGKARLAFPKHPKHTHQDTGPYSHASISASVSRGAAS